MMLQLCIKAGSVVLGVLLATVCLAGPRVTTDRLCPLIEKARSGDPAAQCELGLAYFYGRGVRKDPAEAKCWIRRAYDTGSAQAEMIWNDLELWTYEGECGTLIDGLIMAPRNRAGDILEDPVTGIRFIWIPGGCFPMGCSPGSAGTSADAARDCPGDARPEHRVCLTGFWMGQTEVTQSQWASVMQSNPSRFAAGGGYPVESVSFDDIQGFIERLNRKSPYRFSLPTEAQWEYACRNGGKNQPGPAGARPRANCGTCDSSPYRNRTSPAGSFAPDRLGLVDMRGNVKEWCRDVYQKAAYRRHRMKNPVSAGPDGAGSAPRVVRGASWTDNADQMNCWIRNSSLPGIKSHNLGFRLVLEVF